MGEVWIPRIKAGVILRDLKTKEPGDISVEDIAWTRGAIVVEDGLRGADARLGRRRCVVGLPLSVGV
jgi:hypothetical protein